MKEAAKNGDTIEHEHRPAESWTTDPGYAALAVRAGHRLKTPAVDV